MSAEYIPTTETVRDFYQFGRHENGNREGQGAREAEFDRWLESVRKEAYQRGWDNALEFPDELESDFGKRVGIVE